jgi:hypothetical protein
LIGDPKRRVRSSAASASGSRASSGSATSAKTSRAVSIVSGVMGPRRRASHAAKNCWNTSWMNRPRARGDSVGSSSGDSSSRSTSVAKNLNGQSWYRSSALTE